MAIKHDKHTSKALISLVGGVCCFSSAFSWAIGKYRQVWQIWNQKKSIGDGETCCLLGSSSQYWYENQGDWWNCDEIKSKFKDRNVLNIWKIENEC